MIEIPKKLCASALALALAGFTGAGCIDNSGNNTYPRDAGSPDEAADTGTDTPASSDAPAGDTTAPSDGGASSDAPAGDAGSDRARDTATGGDALGVDVRLDLAAAG